MRALMMPPTTTLTGDEGSSPSEPERQSSANDVAALGEMIPAVYEQLRNLTEDYLRGERANHTLQATALVHEAYLRLRDQRKVDWRNRAQFLGIAARMMRRVLKNGTRPRRWPRQAVDHFAKIVRRNICRHSDSDMRP